MARRRASRGVNTRPMRALVLDDIGAAPTPSADGTTERVPTTGSLAGRERLDARLTAWMAERERFVRRGARRADAAEPEPESKSP